MNSKVIRIKQVVELTGLPKSTIYTYIKRGTFPTQIQLGPRVVGWRESEVLAWLDQCQQARV